MLNPYLVAVALLLDLVAIVGLVLVHFGVLVGFIPIAPWLFAGSIGFWLANVGLKHPVAVISAVVVLGILLEGVIALGWWGFPVGG